MSLKSKFLISNDHYRSGQTALIVLLIVATALTVGLASSKKVVVDTKIDKDEEMLKQAFNVAESGIENYLSTGNTTYLATDNSSTADVKAVDIGAAPIVSYGGLIAPGKPAVFWLAGHDADKNIVPNVYSGLVDLCASGTSGGVKVYYFYTSGGYKVNRLMYNLGDAGGNEIAKATRANNRAAGHCPAGLTKIDTLDARAASVSPLMIVMVPVISATKLAVASSDGVTNLPKQGEVITSTGTVGVINQQAGAIRTVSQENRYDGGLLEYMLESIEANQGVTN